MTEHEKFIELMSQYCDGEISENEKAELFSHIETCSDCTSFFEIMKITTGVFAEKFEVPESLLPNVMDGVRKAKKKKQKVIFLRWASAAACFALILFAGFKLLPGPDKTADSAMRMEIAATPRLKTIAPETAEDRAAEDDRPEEKAAEEEIGDSIVFPKMSDSKSDTSEKEDAPAETNETDKNKSIGSTVPPEVSDGEPVPEMPTDETLELFMNSPFDEFSAVKEAAVENYRTVLIAYEILPEALEELKKTEEGEDIFLIPVPDSLAEELSNELEVISNEGNGEGTAVIYLP